MKQSAKTLSIRLLAAVAIALGALIAFPPAPAQAQQLTAGLTDTVGSVLKGKKKDRGPKGVHCGSRFVTEYNYDADGNVKCYVHNSELSCRNGYSFSQTDGDRGFNGEGKARRADYQCVDHSVLGLPVLDASTNKKRSCRRGFDRVGSANDPSYTCESRTLECPTGFKYVKGDVYPSGFAYFCHKG